MLPNPTIRKLMRENFPEAEIAASGPLNVPEPEQRNWLESLRKQLHGRGRVSGSIADRDNQPVVLSIQVNDHSDRYYGLESFNLQFGLVDDREGLFIRHSSYGYYRSADEKWIAVSSIDQIESFLSAIQARQDYNNLRDIKKQKQINLLKTNVTGQLRDLARIHNFSFSVSESTRDITISLRIGGLQVGDSKSDFHVAFAKSKLHAMLERIPRLIALIQEFHANGIRFDRRTHSSVTWIKPEKEQTDPESHDANNSM